jgi:hypothetical protein
VNRHKITPLCYVKVSHASFMPYFQESSIIKTYALGPDISDKVLKAQISGRLIVGYIGKRYHPFRVRLGHPTGPVIGRRSLMLLTFPASTVERLNFAGIYI